MNRYDYDPPLSPPLWDERADLAFIDFVVMPVLILLFVPILIFVGAVDLWDRLRGKRW